MVQMRRYQQHFISIVLSQPWLIYTLLLLCSAEKSGVTLLAEQLPRLPQTFKQLLSAVPMMNIEVDDRHPLDLLPVNVEHIGRCNSHIVKYAEPIGLSRREPRVMLSQAS